MDYSKAGQHAPIFDGHHTSWKRYGGGQHRFGNDGIAVISQPIHKGNNTTFFTNIEHILKIGLQFQYLTKSELHVVMSSGFATVSGTVLAAYMNFGAEASHLITSSVMAAPATLAFSKLFYPEVEISQTTSKSMSMEKSYVS